MVTICTASITFNNCKLCPHCIYVFCIYLRTNIDLCHLQHKLIGFYNRDLTLYNPVVTICTASITFNNCKLCPHCIYVFCIYLRTNSDLCHLQHKLIGFYNRDLTLYSPVVTICTTSITFNNCTLCPHCIYVFCIYLRKNSDLCHLQHKLIGFYNRGGKCLQGGTDLFLIYRRLRLFFKRLISIHNWHVYFNCIPLALEKVSFSHSIYL